MKMEVLRRAFGSNPFTTAGAAEAWGIRNPASTLLRLKEAGAIERLSRGVYRVASDDVLTAIAGHLERLRIDALRQERDKELPALARMRWQAWIDSGYVQVLGDNAFRVQPKSGTGARVRVV